MKKNIINSLYIVAIGLFLASMSSGIVWFLFAAAVVALVGKGLAISRRHRRNMRRKKILIADPDINIVDTLTDRLTLNGYGVMGTDNWRVTILMAMKSVPDLIIIDQKMVFPCNEDKGLDAIEEIRSHGGRFADIPVIVMGNENTRIDKSKLNRNNHIVFKPFDLSEMLDLVWGILGKN